MLFLSFLELFFCFIVQLFLKYILYLLCLPVMKQITGLSLRLNFVNLGINLFMHAASLQMSFCISLLLCIFYMQKGARCPSCFPALYTDGLK